MYEADVLIVGGGVVGLCAALAMQQLGFSVVVLEKGSLSIQNPAVIPRVYAINRASEQLLTQIGVWERLDKSALLPYRAMHVSDHANGASIDFDARMIASSYLGVMLEEATLKQALLTSVAEAGVKLVSGYQVSEVVQDELQRFIQVTDTSDVWQGRLLIVADGAMSPVRNLLKVPLTTWSYHQHAIVATVRTTLPHEATAYQVFQRNGPLALLPMASAHACSIVWTTSPEEAKTLLASTDECFNDALTSAFGTKLGQLELTTARHCFPLTMRHVDQYVGPNWLLMGDAAHTIHPLAGLGLNAGLADLAFWLDSLKKASRTAPAWSLRQMASYQRHRKHALWQLIVIMEGLNRLFKNSEPFVSACRGVGLHFSNTCMPIKRLLIEYASGTR